MTYRTMPKIDLHCHLDGSLPLATIKELMGMENIKVADKKLEEAIRVDGSSTDLAGYLTKFELPLKLLKTPESFEIATYNLLKDLAAENMIYTELRFAPFLTASNMVEAKEIVEAAIRGLDKARESFAIEANLILCCMRHQDQETNLKVLDLAKAYLGQGVCAVDLAGDEAQYPMALYEDLFKQASQMKISYTIHAGESGDPDNIRGAIELGAKRIGHGIAMMKDQTLFELCRKHEIGIEMCPTSNRQTRAIQDMKDYPYQLFMEEGLLVTINTDNRTVSNTTINEEIKLLESYGPVDYRQCLQNAVQVSFASEKVKTQLLKEILKSER